jgi:3-oxoacyl-[acyl-carrier protein] reductase
VSGWALVTGSSKGIGAAIAEGLATDGYDVVVHYGRDREGAEQVAQRCADHGVGTRVVGADLREDPGPLAAAADDVGGLAALVNNAGVTADGLAMTMSDDDFALTWQVNVAAAFALTRAALRRMLRARSGRIVMMSSVVGLHGNAGQANYAASKAALVGMTKSIAREVGRRGITANVVAPGFIETAMTEAVDASGLVERVPAGRLGTVDEVAAAVRFLCSPEATYVNGAVLQVDGGLFA